MKSTEVKVYEFDELSDEAKEKVIEHYQDVNVDYEWWEFVYEDAKEVGLDIQSFDIDRRDIKGEFTKPAPEVAEAILKSHGDKTETYKDAKKFLTELEALTSEHEDIEDVNEDAIEELEDDFRETILQDYVIMLQDNYEYLTSKEAIIETIQANEYRFTEDGGTEIYTNTL